MSDINKVQGEITAYFRAMAEYDGEQLVAENCKLRTENQNLRERIQRGRWMDTQRTWLEWNLRRYGHTLFWVVWSIVITMMLWKAAHL